MEWIIVTLIVVAAFTALVWRSLSSVKKVRASAKGEAPVCKGCSTTSCPLHEGFEGQSPSAPAPQGEACHSDQES